MDDSPHALMKQCTGPCGRTLLATLEFFSRQRRGKYGLRSICKACQKAYREAHETDVKAYLEAHKEQTREYNKQYSEAHKEQKRETDRLYYQTHSERIIEQVSQYQKAHARQYYEWHKRYSASHRELVRESDKKYSKTERGRMTTRASRNRRRAQELIVKGTHTAAQIQEQLKRQRYRCYYAACGFAKI